MIFLHKKGKERRKLHIRKKIHGTSSRPRVSVFRSNKYLYAQIVDDDAGKTLVALCEGNLNLPKDKKLTKRERAKLLGEFLAEKVKERKITKVILDRNGYKYHGRIKIFAEGLRGGGLKF